ncbi:hypothetical protein [Saccharopolyspora taberi]|uniref:Transposase n=1 Tax=Saccharopolyspora taberi TaxID=60895 RepID=A0ABN3V9C2_9PSEU
MDVDEAVRALYRVPPPDFVAERDRQAALARDGGDGHLAAELKKQRKPVLAAWAVNLLAGSARKQLDALVDVGARMRSAQRDLRADEVRTLDRERARLQRELTATAVKLAEQAGHPLGGQAVQQVEQTLHAAVSDPSQAAQVQAGTLVKPLSYSGFGLDELSAEALLRAPERQKPAAPKKKLRAELAAAAEDVRRDEQSLAEARRTLEEAEQRQAELQEQLDQAAREVDDAREAVRKARQQHEQAQQRHRELQARDQ